MTVLRRRPCSLRLACAALAAAAACIGLARTARADGYAVFIDDRAGFEAALDIDAWSTVVDSADAFAADPSAATGLGAVVRTGTVGGEAFSYALRDANFANAPTGSITPGSAGGDLSSTSQIDVERPATQNGAVGAGTWGVDGGGGGSTTRNALIVDFTTTPLGLGLGHFGLDLIDFETLATGVPAQLRLYRAGSLVFSRDFEWAQDDGRGLTHFLGVVRVAGEGAAFDQLALVVGGSSTSAANGASYAADGFTFGRAVANPEPWGIALFVLGAAAAGVARRFALRRQRHGSDP